MNDLKMFLQSRLPFYLSLLKDMVEINSFTANSQGVNQLGQLTAQVFSDLGFQSEFIQSVNPSYGKHLFMVRQVSVNSASDNPAIAMVSHLDTVFSPEEELHYHFSWKQVGDRIYGPGTMDIKGGTVMIYMVLDAFRQLYPQIFETTEWHIAIDASEEALSDDFGRLCLEHFPEKTLAGLVFEGGTPDNDAFPLVVARKGRASFHVIAEGRSAHAGNHHDQGANAILQLAHTVQQIESFTNYQDKLTFNVGKICGGSVTNRVPHYAEADVEMRSFSPKIFATGVQRIMDLNGSSQVSSADGFPCKVIIQNITQSAPWSRNPASDHLFDVWQKAAQTLGQKVKMEERGGLSDGNLIYHHFPTLDGLGPTGDNAHCSESSADGSKEQEYALASSFVSKAMLNVSAILNLLQQ